MMIAKPFWRQLSRFPAKMTLAHARALGFVYWREKLVVVLESKGLYYLSTCNSTLVSEIFSFGNEAAVAWTDYNGLLRFTRLSGKKILRKWYKLMASVHLNSNFVNYWKLWNIFTTICKIIFLMALIFYPLYILTPLENWKCFVYAFPLYRGMKVEFKSKVYEKLIRKLIKVQIRQFKRQPYWSSRYRKLFIL